MQAKTKKTKIYDLQILHLDEKKQEFPVRRQLMTATVTGITSMTRIPVFKITTNNGTLMIQTCRISKLKSLVADGMELNRNEYFMVPVKCPICLKKVGEDDVKSAYMCLTKCGNRHMICSECTINWGGKPCPMCRGASGPKGTPPIPMPTRVVSQPVKPKPPCKAKQLSVPPLSYAKSSSEAAYNKSQALTSLSYDSNEPAKVTWMRENNTLMEIGPGFPQSTSPSGENKVVVEPNQAKTWYEHNFGIGSNIEKFICFVILGSQPSAYIDLFITYKDGTNVTTTIYKDTASTNKTVGKAFHRGDQRDGNFFLHAALIEPTMKLTKLEYGVHPLLPSECTNLPQSIVDNPNDYGKSIAQGTMMAEDEVVVFVSLGAYKQDTIEILTIDERKDASFVLMLRNTNGEYKELTVNVNLLNDYIPNARVYTGLKLTFKREDIDR